jgi:hypothetical protein
MKPPTPQQLKQQHIHAFAKPAEDAKPEEDDSDAKQ